MKKVLLLALLGSFAAQAMDAPMAGPKGKIFVNSINNETKKNWVFVAGNTSIKIPAEKTILVNRALDYKVKYMIPIAQIQLDPMPDKGFTHFTIVTKRPYKIGYSRQNKNKWNMALMKFSQLRGPAINIQITQDKGEYSLSFKPGASPKGKEKEEEPSKPKEKTTIRILTYAGKQYTLDLNAKEPLSLETYKDLIKAGKELVGIVSKGASGVFVHFYDKAKFEKYSEGKDKDWVDPITRLKIIGYIDIEQITDKELIG